MSRIREMFRRAEEVAKIDSPQKKRATMDPFNEEGMDSFVTGGHGRDREPTPEEGGESEDGPHWDDLARFGGDW